MGLKYNNLLKDFTNKYNTAPLDISMEVDMQWWLVDLLETQFEKEGKQQSILDPGLQEFQGETVLVGKDTASEYKKPYIDQLMNCYDGGAVEVSRIQPELNVTDDEKPNRQYDIGVLQQELSKPIRWNDGSKRYNSGDVEAAFELKFIANQNIISTSTSASERTSMDTAEIHNMDYETEIAEADDDLQPDIKGLRELPTDETYLVIVSQYNYLMQTPIHGKESAYRERNAKLESLIDEWFTNETSDSNDPDVLYLYPGGQKTWGNISIER